MTEEICRDAYGGNIIMSSEGMHDMPIELRSVLKGHGRMVDLADQLYDLNQV